MYLALRKCKNDCKILTVNLVPDFGPLKPEIARFSLRFRLKGFMPVPCSLLRSMRQWFSIIFVK